MRKLEKVTQTVEVDEIADMLCDACGKSMLIGQGKFQFAEGTSLVASFGYGSNKDGLTERIDICDECYDRWTLSFKNTPEEVY